MHDRRRTIDNDFSAILHLPSSILSARFSVALCLCVAFFNYPTSAAAEGKFVDLGPQITSSLLIGTTFTKDASGRDLVCTVMRGHPAKLIVFDVRNGELLHRMPLAGANGAWNACTASDGSVYVATDDNAHLYRWMPAEDEVHDLGQVAPKQTFAWDVCAGKDGEVFVGTYPGCLVIRYQPDAGFSDVGHGSVAPGENYARSVTYDPRGGKIYVGVGSHAKLIELDPKTGEKRNVLPKEYADQEWVYGVEAMGDNLYAYISRLGKSLVMDIKSHEVKFVLPGMSGQQIITRSPDDGRVYYTFNGKLHCYDPGKPALPSKNLGAMPDALSFAWIAFERDADFPGQSLVSFNRQGGITRFNPKTGKHATLAKCELPAEETDIQSIELGPDGRMWTGGYLSGGNAAFDPRTGKSEQYKGLSQSEDITVLGKTIYFGLYPGARMSMYDTTKPWDAKQDNPRQFGDLGKEHNQSRPMAMCGVEELGRVFIGTIPEYGQLGGVLAIYDPKSDKLDVHHDVVPKQSITSLAFVKNMIVGGTSIWGGLGQQPEEKEAKVFLWDPANNEKVFETAPVSGAGLISGLFKGPDGNAWGMAGGTLFIFDVPARKVVFTKELFATRAGSNWRDAFFAITPTGRIYGTANNSLFELDAKTKEVTVIREKGAKLLSMDREGRLYFGAGTHLWQYTP